MGRLSTDHFQSQLMAAAELMRCKCFDAAEASLRQLLAATLPSLQSDPVRGGGRVIAVLSALFALQLTQGRREDAAETALVIKEAAWATDDFARTGDMTWWDAVTPGVAGYCGFALRPSLSVRLEHAGADLRIA